MVVRARRIFATRSLGRGAIDAKMWTGCSGRMRARTDVRSQDLLAQHGPLSEAPQNVLALLIDCVCGLLFGESKVG